MMLTHTNCPVCGFQFVPMHACKPTCRTNCYFARSHDYIPHFWSKVDKSDPDQCWNYTGAQDKDGYGMFSYYDHQERAHRVAYVLTFGVFDIALLVCHKCDNPSCCNPSHLFVGTTLINNRDSWSKGRSRGIPRDKRGVNSNAKLTETDVREIRRLFTSNRTVSYAAIGAMYGVKSATIGAILTNRHWAHLL